MMQFHTVNRVKSRFSTMFLSVLLLAGAATAQAGEQTIKIGALVSGQISKLYVTEGQTVTKGQRLLNIDSARFQAKLALLKAKLKLAKVSYDDAKIEFDQAQDLFDRTVTSKRSFDAAQLKFDQALAQYDQAKAAVALHQAWSKYVYVKAPVAAKVSKIHTPEGSTVFKENTPMIELTP